MAGGMPGHLFHSLPFYDIVMADETVVVDLHNRPDITNIRGAIQGGLIATLIDVAAGQLAARAAPEGCGVSTADMNIHFLEPVFIGPARASATMVRAGRRSIVVAVDVTDVHTGKLSSRATLTFAVSTPRTSQPATTP